MKYRIVERKYSDGKKYYLAQYMNGGAWETLSEYKGSIFQCLASNKNFSSIKQAKKALYKKRQELAYANFSKEVAQGEL